MVDTTKERAYTVAEQIGATWRGNAAESFAYKLNLEHKVVDALIAAGMLRERTGIEERAVAACRVYAKEIATESCGFAVALVGREILAAETPKPSWSLKQRGAQPIYDVHLVGEQRGPFTYEQARAVMDALNKLNRVDAEGRP